ncbi:unnamed protein product [Cochlearia groenlandica]
MKLHLFPCPKNLGEDVRFNEIAEMLEDASLSVKEPFVRKRKLEAAPVNSPQKDKYSYDEGGYSTDEEMNPVEREKYRLQVVESCGKKLEFQTVVKTNGEIGSLYNSYSTSVVVDRADNSLHTFQACVTDEVKKNKANLILTTKICRIKPLVPGFGDATTIWDFDAIDDFYKDKCFLKVIFYFQVEESELRDNDWLYLYAEVAAFSIWSRVMSSPCEMRKIMVQTKENGESSKNLKSRNAIFYISFKVPGGPECKGIIRKTSDGITGHLCLEVRCWIEE